MLDEVFARAAEIIRSGPVPAAPPRRGSRIRGDENVDFGSNAEVFEIDSRLDREERAGQDAALVVRFEIVHIRAGAVNFGSDRVAGAMDKTVAESPVADVISRCIVHFESADVALRLHRLATASMARSRASRTVSNTSRTRSGGRLRRSRSR